MNKAEEIILKSVVEGSAVYEMIRTGFAERKTRLLDMLFDETLTLNRAFSQLKGKEAYFLVCSGNHAELVTVSGGSISDRKDATVEASGKTTFTLGDYRYKRYRKIW
ncbi:hypothetical protein SAMN04488127_1519 [Bhargavaea ginsengi]|uniref:Uncharacterized protein n=1 Tax=Bhargavaea ginsengi TaxID=426757 RepID=A0A1H6XWF1_9BACL|nr:hypothetical protein [Bhargavaea ginsengi]SEJ29180.1 hypothetical protein SAMN04488127_1519 [Bhargavaea ginsengi]